MCEYCGCQALATIRDLTAEHDAVVNLIGAVRTAHHDGDAPGMAAAARAIAAVLRPHTEVEERGLFPFMAVEFPDHIAVLEAEHRHIEAVLGEAAGGTPTDPTWPRRLLDTLGRLRAHILKEQDGVFPAALAQLSGEEWEAVEAVRTRVGTALPGPAD
ncbi:hemerythrin domain-containing protein [Kitasatospora sp. NPDC101447]|uniref:hemerythrin domain-containing protein n=1 Tax=Kitasatospora sp. NPDC101447 TaxID=3364102 RepID=UPI003819F135